MRKGIACTWEVASEIKRKRREAALFGIKPISTSLSWWDPAVLSLSYNARSVILSQRWSPVEAFQKSSSEFYRHSPTSLEDRTSRESYDSGAVHETSYSGCHIPGSTLITKRCLPTLEKLFRSINTVKLYFIYWGICVAETLHLNRLIIL